MTSAAQKEKPRARETMLSRPMYALDLPADLLRSLRVRSVDVKLDEDERPSRTASPTSFVQSACAVCPGVRMQRSAMEIRAHLRSDWHRYNVGLSKRGQTESTVDEDTFHKLIEEVSSEEDEDTDTEERAPLDTVTNLLERLQIRAGVDAGADLSATDEESGRDNGQMIAQESHVWFLTKPDAEKYVEQTQFGMLRQVLAEDHLIEGQDSNWQVQALKQAQCERLSKSAVDGVKRIRGAQAAEEASKVLGAVFLDASGESGLVDEDIEEEEEEAESESAEAVSTTGFMEKTHLRTWTIILFGGGDFSAITITLNPYEHFASKRKGTLERQFVVIARKQFHRYTTRRKQGGSQSAQDASGRFAKSAGANLRRYGEQQLGQEIRELLDTPQWREAISGSEKVWIRAGLRSARGVLWNWSSGGAAHESPLDEMRRRGLVQNLPIATRKPTVGECLRCFAELTRVRVRHETEEEMQQRDDAYRAQIESSRQAREERQKRQKERLQRQAERQKAAAAARNSTTKKMDPIQQLRRERFMRLVDMFRKGRLSSIIRHLDKYEEELFGDGEQEPDDVDDAMLAAQKRVNTPLPEWWRVMDAKAKRAEAQDDVQIDVLTAKQKLVPSTLLQLAAEGGHESVVTHFLVDRKSDPTISVAPPPPMSDGGQLVSAALFPHRTAYDLCSTREARDVFRRQMAVEPDRCDWSGTEKGTARVPKALTEEMEESRKKEEGVRDKRQEMRERARRRQEQEAIQKAHTITEEDRSAAVVPCTSVKQPSSSAHSNKLGGSNTLPRTLQQQRDNDAGLSPEMRARIEREKRARAAEARFRSLQQG